MQAQEDTHKELVREYLNAFNERDREAMADLLAEDVVEHGRGRPLHGVDEILDVLDAHFEAFPDYTGTTEEMIAEDETVAIRYTVSGTHTGEFHGVEPTGHKTEWSGMAFYRIADGNIAEIWIREDHLGLLDQLDVVEQPAYLRV